MIVFQPHWRQSQTFTRVGQSVKDLLRSAPFRQPHLAGLAVRATLMGRKET